MNYVGLALRLCLMGVALYLLWFLAFWYTPADPLGFHPPFLLWVMDTINLFIHEGGHFVFRLFGQTLYMLGGSIMQCALPLALTLVTWREKPHQAAYPLFWFGENMVNIGAYIEDAPYKNLRLIKKGLIHDWNWLLADHLDWAEPLGTAARGAGVFVCAGAVLLMGLWAVRIFRNKSI